MLVKDFCLHVCCCCFYVFLKLAQSVLYNFFYLNNTYFLSKFMKIFFKIPISIPVFSKQYLFFHSFCFIFQKPNEKFKFLNAAQSQKVRLISTNFVWKTQVTKYVSLVGTVLMLVNPFQSEHCLSGSRMGFDTFSFLCIWFWYTSIYFIIGESFYELSLSFFVWKILRENRTRSNM